MSLIEKINFEYLKQYLDQVQSNTTYIDLIKIFGTVFVGVSAIYFM